MADMKAVKFDHYGDVDVLEVRHVLVHRRVPARCLWRSRRQVSTRARPRSARAQCTTVGRPHFPRARVAT